MYSNKTLVIDNIKAKILSNIKPKSIILFGSVAKGTNQEESDIDLLIVWDENKDMSNIKRRIMLRKIIGMVDTPLDIITCTSDEFSKALEDENSFTSQIVKEGEKLYG